MYPRMIGIGLALAGSVLVARFWRPVAKGIFRGYFSATDHLKEFVAETGEGVQDLYAEAKSEYQKDMEASAAAGEEVVEELTPKRARSSAKKLEPEAPPQSTN